MLSDPLQKKFTSLCLNTMMIYYFFKFCYCLGSAEQGFFYLYMVTDEITFIREVANARTFKTVSSHVWGLSAISWGISNFLYAASHSGLSFISSSQVSLWKLLRERANIETTKPLKI